MLNDIWISVPTGSENDECMSGTIHLFDPTVVGISGAYPYNYRNELNENAIPSGLYPNLIDNFFYRRCWISDSRAQDVTQISPDLYIGTTRCKTQVKAI